MDVVIGAALIGVERVAFGGGEPLPRGWLLRLDGDQQISRADGRGHPGFHGRAQFVLDGDIHHRFEIRAGKTIALLRRRIIVHILDRFAAQVQTQNGRPRGSVQSLNSIDKPSFLARIHL